MERHKLLAFMERYRQPAIMLHRPYPPIDMPESNSFLGGTPALPDRTEWPRARGGVPLHFLAQIDCAELPPSDGMLPDAGVLFFFARVNEEMDWGGGHPNDDCRVIFTPAAGPTPVSPPDDLPSIMGGHADFDRNFTLPGEPAFNRYPRWPIVANPIQSWPDVTAIPGYWQRDLDGYQEMVERARAAEAVRVTGLPTVTGSAPHWGQQSFDPDRRWAVSLPQFEDDPFPQTWIMVDRIARYLANWASSEGERRAREPARTQDAEAVQEVQETDTALQTLQTAALRWAETAGAQGLDAAPDAAARQRFNDWFEALACGEDHILPIGVAGALRFGMKSAVQYAADSPDAARLVPPSFYNELENDHLPAWSSKSVQRGGLAKWRIDSRYHQMLGNTRSTQEAEPIVRDQVLLLQLISDYGVDFMFCDCGEIEFWIGLDDLSARNFANVRARTCGG